jgi:ankyrin repeat protein
MSTRLTPAESEEIQKRYAYLVNYDCENPNSPIDPMIYRDSNGDNLLHIASQRGDLRTVQLLVEAGLLIDERGDMDCTALHYARINGHDEVAEFLVRRGASQTLRNAFGRLPGK